MPSASRTNAKSIERWSLPATQARSRATRERILAAAESVFAQRGYEGARLADIAEEAGCSVGAVYFRFKDKDALFFAIAESFAGEARNGLAALLAGTSDLDAAATIRTFVTATAASFRHHKGLFRAIVERGMEHPHAMKTVFALRDELARALEKSLGVADASLKIRVMTQMVYGFMVAGVLNKSAPTKITDSRAIAELANACIAYFHAGDA
ncbi:MAG TPA: TetR/AcrR family transcriptional regulator [Rhizomicrobium sp.]|jgi:AcrR family transcriptional regulator